MSNATQTGIGAVVSLRRYPVKSMQGEELATAQVRDYGLLGDRVYALLDNSDNKIATAKNPKKWPNLFSWRASFVTPPDGSGAIPAVRMTLPDGTQLTSEQNDLNQALSKALNRNVTFPGYRAQPGRGRAVVDAAFLVGLFRRILGRYGRP
jgi:uncharacterized protein